MQIVSLDYWLGFSFVILIIVFLGFYATRQVKNADDFVLAGKSSGAFMVMGSVVGTAVGASATIGTAQMAFIKGLSAWWFCLGCGIGFFIMAFTYISPFTKSTAATVSQFLIKAYSSKIGVASSISSVLGLFFSVAASCLVLIPMIATCFSVDLLTGLYISLFLIIMYVFFGGAWATGLMGIFKTLSLYVVLVLAFLATVKVVPITSVIANYPAFPWFSLFPNSFVVDIAAGISTIIGVMCTQTYIQGFCGAKDEKTAKRGMFLSAFFTAFAALPAIWIGLFMKMQHPDIMPINALPLFINYYFPPWLSGFAFGVLLIAALGSAAGLILGMATIVNIDIVTPLFKEFSKKYGLTVTRIMVFVISLFTLVFTYINHDALILDWTILSMCLRSAGIFLPLIFAIFKPGFFKANFAIMAVFCGTLGALLWRIFFPDLYSPLYPGLFISLIFMILGYKGKGENCC